MYHLIPLVNGQATVDHLAGDAVFHHAIHQTGIEVIAGTDGAHRLGGNDGITLAQTLGAQLHGSHTLCIDELLAIERDLGIIHLVAVVFLEHHHEVLVTAPHHIGQLQVLQDVGRHLHQVVTVTGTEVHIVVENGATLLGILQKTVHLRTDDGIDGIERAVHHNIVGLHVGIDEVQLVVRMVLIENVVGIVVLIEKGQRDGRLGVWKAVHIVAIHAVLPQELHDGVAHTVVAGLADKGGWHTRTAQRDDAIEHTAARHSTDGLAAAEYNVENRLANTDYLAHKKLFLSDCATKIMIFLMIQAKIKLFVFLFFLILAINDYFCTARRKCQAMTENSSNDQIQHPYPRQRTSRHPPAL